MRIAITVGVLLLSLPQLAQAQVCGAGGEMFSRCPDQENSIVSVFQLPNSDNPIADNFSLFQPAVIDSVSWYGGFYFPYGPAPFEIRLYTDNGGTPSRPADLIQVWQFQEVAATFTGQLFYSFETGEMQTEYYFTAPLSPAIELAADTKYWISIVEVNTDPELRLFLWESTGESNDGSWISFDGGQSWTQGVGFDLAMMIDGQPAIDDCNSNGIDDATDLANCPNGQTWCDDCNNNLVLDTCDIASGFSRNRFRPAKGIPDECEIVVTSNIRLMFPISIAPTLPPP